MADKSDNVCINSDKIDVSLTFRSAIARTLIQVKLIQMPSGYFQRWRKSKMETMSNFPTMWITYHQNPYPGDITYDQNPYPGDRPHDQNPVVGPTLPPSGLTLIGALQLGEYSRLDAYSNQAYTFPLQTTQQVSLEHDPPI